MSRTATHAGVEARERNAESPHPTPDEIQTQIRLILTSPVFHGSKRCQQFLEYVCEKSLAGEVGALKERSIAIEVFGRRPEAAGLGEDTIVRVGAREVRKRLAQYYVTADGAASAVIIDLAPGAYVPEFRYTTTRSAVPAAPPQAELHHAAPEATLLPPITPGVTAKGRRLGRRHILAAAACLAILGSAVLILTGKPARSPGQADVAKFWAPVFAAADPLLIGVGHPIVYLPSRRVSLLNAQKEPASQWPVQRKIDLPPGDLNGSDMVPAINQFVGFGDMVAANEVSQMLARRSRRVQVLMASSIPFADLRRHPTYLIGSFSNQWTVELSHTWLVSISGGPKTTIRYSSIRNQSRSVSGRSLQPTTGSTPDDYSLICRIRKFADGGNC